MVHLACPVGSRQFEEAQPLLRTGYPSTDYPPPPFEMGPRFFVGLMRHCWSFQSITPPALVWSHWCLTKGTLCWTATDGEEVMVRANQLDIEGDEMEEGMNYYDEESLCLCGLEDFLLVLQGYRNFIMTK